MNSEAESINNFKFLIELSITQFSEFFNLKLLKNSLALAANSRSLNSKKRKGQLRVQLATIDLHGEELSFSEKSTNPFSASAEEVKQRS